MQNRELELMITASGLTMREALELTDMPPEMIDEVCGPTGNLADDSVEIITDGAPVLVGRNLEKACARSERPWRYQMGRVFG
jgi:hypothetical protein